MELVFQVTEKLSIFFCILKRIVNQETEQQYAEALAQFLGMTVPIVPSVHGGFQVKLFSYEDFSRLVVGSVDVSESPLKP